MLSSRALRRKTAILRSLPTNEAHAVELWLDACFLPFQQEWIFDWSRFSQWVKSRQIGGSHSTAGQLLIWAILGETSTIVSIGETEAKRVLETAAKHARILSQLGSQWARKSDREYIVGNELQIRSGGKLIAAPASSAGRGLSGNVFLDEFAYPRGHNDTGVRDAAIGAITHGGRLRVVSTPNGKRNLFYDFATDPAFAAWSHHTTTVHDAIRGGMAIDLREMFIACASNARLFARVYECSFEDLEGALFEGVNYYDKLPDSYTVSIGIDLAYTAKTSSDYCAYVVLAKGKDVNGAEKIYVIDALHEKSSPAPFSKRLASLKAAWPNTQMFWYGSTTEDGNAELMRELLGFPIIATLASSVGKKYQRALPAAVQWNQANILVPHDASWVAEFMREIGSFTGDEGRDGHDDFVDALASAFDALPMSAPMSPRKTIKTKFTTGASVSPFASGKGWAEW
jgi:predicted phage terminase large subunit-like protein